MKAKAEHDRNMSIKYATGLGEDTLKSMWWKSTGSADELARLIRDVAS